VTDRFDLQRFVEAQAPIYSKVCEELRAGRKESHWMWFIFPQIAGLGQSPTSVRFAISSLDEASAYLTHPILGPRLETCANLTLQAHARTVRDIFGPVDAVKFHTSMTLFAKAAGEGSVFRKCLQTYFGGALDPATVARL
jgi:uncharacterized protein (DUF1810 family)